MQGNSSMKSLTNTRASNGNQDTVQSSKIASNEVEWNFRDIALKICDGIGTNREIVFIALGALEKKKICYIFP